MQGPMHFFPPQRNNGYPDNTIWMSCDDDVLCVPFVHLRHTAAQDLLAAPGECVGTSDRVAINAPYMDVRSSARHYISLCNKCLGYLQCFFLFYFTVLCIFIRFSP